MLRIEATARLKYSRSMSGGGHMAVSVTRESAHSPRRVSAGDATCTGDDEAYRVDFKFGGFPIEVNGLQVGPRRRQCRGSNPALTSAPLRGPAGGDRLHHLTSILSSRKPPIAPPCQWPQSWPGLGAPGHSVAPLWTVTTSDAELEAQWQVLGFMTQLQIRVLQQPETQVTTDQS